MMDRPEEYRKMADVEQHHWWYRSLHDLVLHSLEHNQCQRSACIIDAGCGTGGLMMFLQEHGYNQVIGCDISEEGIKLCRNRGLNVFQRDLRELSAVLPLEKADVVIANDVLYFFEPPQLSAVMRLFESLLVPGGLLLCNLPALPAFRGMHDLCVGIRKRFNRREVESMAGNTSLKIVRMCYWPFVLSPAVFAVRVFQRAQLRLQKNCTMKSDVEMPCRVFNHWLYSMVSLENRLLTHKPFGSSLFCVARKLMEHR